MWHVPSGGKNVNKWCAGHDVKPWELPYFVKSVRMPSSTWSACREHYQNFNTPRNTELQISKFFPTKTPSIILGAERQILYMDLPHVAAVRARNTGVGSWEGCCRSRTTKIILQEASRLLEGSFYHACDFHGSLAVFRSAENEATQYAENSTAKSVFSCVACRPFTKTHVRFFTE